MGTALKRFAIAAVLAVAGTTNAASINYGNFGPIPPGLGFLQVTESSITDNVPLYGPPTPFPIGIDFAPTNFGSASSGGNADITEGQLNFSVTGKANPLSLVEISSLSVFESGDYTLVGAGTAATSVFAGVITRITITEVNGSSVAPINISPVNASFSDSLPGTVIVAPWSLGTFIDIKAALLGAGLGYTPNDGATRIDVVINNTLASSSEASTSASIAKKDFRVDVTQGFVIVIPEPGSLMLAGMGALGLVARRRRSVVSA